MSKLNGLSVLLLLVAGTVSVFLYAQKPSKTQQAPKNFIVIRTDRIPQFIEEELNQRYADGGWRPIAMAPTPCNDGSACYLIILGK